MAYEPSVAASHFHELFGREQAIRDIPHRLNGLDYHIAEGIMAEFSSVNDGLDDLNLRDIAAQCHDAIEDFRAIIYNADSPYVFYDLNQTLTQQWNEFDHFARQFKATCEPLTCFLEDHAEILSNNPYPVHHTHRHGFGGMFHRSHGGHHDRYPPNPARVLRSMANDCEAFLGGLCVFTDLYAQLVRELSKYQRLVEQRYATQYAAEKLDRWLSGMQSIVQQYR